MLNARTTASAPVVAEHGACRPPERAVGDRRMPQRPVRLQCRETGEAAGRENRRNLQADDEGRADHRGHDLRDKARTLGADDTKQGNGQCQRCRRCHRAHGGHDAIGAEPAAATEKCQHVDEGRRQQHRDCNRRSRNPSHTDRKNLTRRCRRRENEIEIRPRIESARDRFHRLREQQRPRQDQGARETDECRLIGRQIGVGIGGDRPIGERVHEGRKDDQRDNRIARAPAPACGHERDPVTPAQPELVTGQPGQ